MASERLIRCCLARWVCLCCVLASAITLASSRLEENKTELYDPRDWAVISKQLKDVGHPLNEDTAQHPLRRRRSVSRRKRFMTRNRWYVWPKGIVPYDFNMAALGEYYRDEAVAAFTRWHKYTCIRFVPWVLGETKEKYGLTEESHVTITKGNGCAAHQGNIHYATGQYNSCCGRGTCTHELGHTLGLWHEHQSPMRDDIVKLDRSKVPGNMEWTYNMRSLYLDDIEVYQYDTSNTMHYGGSAFPIMYEDLRPLISFGNQYYMYKDVSLYHKCDELHCGNFTEQCYNGGFVTLVDDQCSCLCPAGLDPGTGCATTITQVDTSPDWPVDAFAMFSSSGGCPGGDSVFASGSWQHKGQGNNRQSSELHLAGSFEADIFRYQFCVKQETSGPAAADWEPGRYCFLRVGGSCPAGFHSGYIQFDDAPESVGQREGSLPDGVFDDNNNTRMDFCCRDDGFAGTPLLSLPNTQPFVLLETRKGQTCQEVRGMRWTEEYMWFDSFAGNATVNGSHPFVSQDTKFKLWFCHYVPVNFNCGGEITLTKSDPQVIITSPNFPQVYHINMECNWIIKAGEIDGQVMLNFDEMTVTSVGNGCKDSLEIRYNLPGQPGIRFCGDGIGRTIRSLNDTVILTLRTDHHVVDTDTGFNLTASLYLPEENGCYVPATKGRLYRGQKNYTRSMKTCLPWTQVTHCQYHAFHPRDFGAGLDDNYCRNPDNTAMPWCYTDSGCQRDFCDVCNIERLYDRSASCPSAVCGKGGEAIITAGCAVACGLLPPVTPDRETECNAPTKPADADFVDSADYSGTVPVGGAVSLQCATGSEKVNITCLSDGSWSLTGYVCGGCSDGWAYFNGSCYQYFPVGQIFSEARQTCAGYGAMVASMKNEKEMKFVSSLRLHLWNMWIGATDMEVENEFRWEDGALVDWFNWDPNNTPNNYGNQDCVEVYTDHFQVYWNDINCDQRFPFVCKYNLSDRTLCVDRHPDCVSTLLVRPELCTQQPDYADQMCPYSCGLCEPDASTSHQCIIPPVSDDVVLVSPQGQGSLARGELVQYVCKEGFALTEGQLSLVCGADGNFIGSLPVCKDPETIIQDSNDVELVNRPDTTSGDYTYTSFGSNLGIRRNGVIKQWKFYSRQAGFSFFQVWRADLQVGNYSMKLVGQNQVLTSGIGEENHDLAEADWIRVQPGDRIGLYEMGSSRGLVPYTYCDSDKYPEDFGVAWGLARTSFADFSPSKSYEFTSDINCRRFSFKAVIHPVDSVPASPDLATSDVGRVTRYYVGSPVHVYVGDSANYYIPADGYVKQWHFFAKHGGTAAFQVWRKRADYGERRYQLLGQNTVKITSDEPRSYTIQVPEGERIAAKAGDIIGFLYGPEGDQLGIPYYFCPSGYTEAENSHWYQPLTSDTAFVGDVYSFGYSGGSWLCRIFSFRAIVEQSQVTAEPPLSGLRTSDIALINRPYLGSMVNSYVGNSSYFTIPVDGHVREWQFFLKNGGYGAFQVWRPRDDIGVRKFQLIGQNVVNITSNEVRPYTLPVPVGERIAVQAGDLIGFLYTNNRLEVPYSLCSDDTDMENSNNVAWYEPITPDTAVIGNVYSFSYSGGSYLCRVFSFRAVVEPLI